MISEEASKHLVKLESELEDLLQREKGLGRLLRFCISIAALDKVLPDLRKLEREGELRLDPRGSLEVTLRFEKGAADFSVSTRQGSSRRRQGDPDPVCRRGDAALHKPDSRVEQFAGPVC